MLKNYLIKILIGTSAFLIGLGSFNVWSYKSDLTDPSNLSDNFCERDLNHAISDLENEKQVLEIELNQSLESKTLFDPEGRYFISDETPKGFENFYYIVIHTRNFDEETENEHWGDLTAPSGFIVLEGAGQNPEHPEHDYIDITNISIGNGKLAFKTDVYKGISYEFGGQFLVRSNFSGLSKIDVLRGEIRKRRNGNTVAKHDVSFGWISSEICFH